MSHERRPLLSRSTITTTATATTTSGSTSTTLSFARPEFRRDSVFSRLLLLMIIAAVLGLVAPRIVGQSRLIHSIRGHELLHLNAAPGIAVDCDSAKLDQVVRFEIHVVKLNNETSGPLQNTIEWSTIASQLRTLKVRINLDQEDSNLIRVSFEYSNSWILRFQYLHMSWFPFSSSFAAPKPVIQVFLYLSQPLVTFQLLASNSEASLSWLGPDIQHLLSVSVKSGIHFFSSGITTTNVKFSLESGFLHFQKLIATQSVDIRVGTASIRGVIMGYTNLKIYARFLKGWINLSLMPNKSSMRPKIWDINEKGAIQGSENFVTQIIKIDGGSGATQIQSFGYKGRVHLKAPSGLAHAFGMDIPLDSVDPLEGTTGGGGPGIFNVDSAEGEININFNDK